MKFPSLWCFIPQYVLQTFNNHIRVKNIQVTPMGIKAESFLAFHSGIICLYFFVPKTSGLPSNGSFEVLSIFFSINVTLS